MDLLTRRVGDMELLVLILLGTSGLYAIVLVVSSYFSATSFARQADQTISHIQDQIGLAMGDLRELQEETEQRLSQMTARRLPSADQPARCPTGVGDPDRRNHRAPGRLARPASQRTRPVGADAGRKHHGLSGSCRRHAGQLLRWRACTLGLGGSTRLRTRRGRASTWSARCAWRRRNRPWLRKSTISWPADSRLPTIFARAMRELAAAFEHQFKTLDERLASDIEEGGKLYELASTPPFDKAVNDLLLNMSIGIG